MCMYIVQIVTFHTNDKSPCLLHDLVQPIYQTCCIDHSYHITITRMADHFFGKLKAKAMGVAIMMDHDIKWVQKPLSYSGWRSSVNNWFWAPDGWLQWNPWWCGRRSHNQPSSWLHFVCKKAGKNDPHMMGSFGLPHSVSRFIWQPFQTFRKSQALRLRPRHPLPWAFGRSGLGSILPTWSPTLWLGRNVEFM